MNKVIIHFFLFSSMLTVGGCLKQPDSEKNTQQGQKKSVLKEQYNVWKAQQNPKLLKEYQQFFASFMKEPPPLMELVTNRNFIPKNCEHARFSIPPKKYWNNLKSSLLLLEKLHQNEYFKSYTITATYRNPELNTCIGGAKRSKHMQNFAVDFHILNPKETHKAESQKLEQKLCEFWRKEGKQYRMGFGVYGNNRFHIDTQSYRTWGKDYSEKTSVCLKY